MLFIRNEVFFWESQHLDTYLARERLAIQARTYILDFLYCHPIILPSLTVQVSAASFGHAAPNLPFTVDARIVAGLGAIALLVLAIKKILDTPSRAYNPDDPNVGASYDDWEQ